MRIDAIPIGVNPPHDVNVIIEVPVGGEPIKYEMDKEAGTLVVDRFLYTAMRYPGNYGFIPHTLSGDGDPCDVLVANTRAIVPGAVMSVRPVGVLLMEDEAGGDEKIIAVPSSKLTQRYDKVKNLQRPSRHHAAADPALLRALQGSRTRQMGQGAALGRRRGRPPADPGRHRAGEARSRRSRKPSWPATNAKRLRKGARDELPSNSALEARSNPLLRACAAMDCFATLAMTRENTMRRLIRIIRNILLLAIAAIVILAGVLAFNTLTHGSRQLQVAAVPRAEVDAQAAAKRLAEAIRFRTISSYEKPDQHAEALRGMQAHIEKSFPAFHAAAKREIVGRYSLLYTWAGLRPEGAADRIARASGRRAGGAGHREGLATAAL